MTRLFKYIFLAAGMFLSLIAAAQTARTVSGTVVSEGSSGSDDASQDEESADSDTSADEEASEDDVD